MAGNSSLRDRCPTLLLLCCTSPQVKWSSFLFSLASPWTFGLHAFKGRDRLCYFATLINYSCSAIFNCKAIVLNQSEKEQYFSSIILSIPLLLKKFKLHTHLNSQAQENKLILDQETTAQEATHYCYSFLISCCCRGLTEPKRHSIIFFLCIDSDKMFIFKYLQGLTEIPHLHLGTYNAIFTHVKPKPKEITIPYFQNQVCTQKYMQTYLQDWSPSMPTPQKPGAGSLEQSWDKNTDLLKHSPVGYTQNISFAITVRQGTVFCPSF